MGDENGIWNSNFSTEINTTITYNRYINTFAYIFHVSIFDYVPIYNIYQHIQKQLTGGYIRNANLLVVISNF